MYKALIVLLCLSHLSLYGQQDCNLKFKGDWVFTGHMHAFEGFTSAYNYNNCDGLPKTTSWSINVTIVDTLNNNPDPTAEQYATYKYICENPEVIKSILIDSSLIYFEDWLDIIHDDTYEFSEEELANKDSLNLVKLMTPLEVNIFLESKDGFAYYGIAGDCLWEPDEGFGYVLHKDRILHAAESYEAFYNGVIKKELGIAKEGNVLQSGIEIAPKPKLYTPHPKYGKLKPKEYCKNIAYVIDLIKHGYSEDVIKLHKEGKIEFDSNHYTQNYLSTAVAYNQLELANYFLAINTMKIDYLLQTATSNLNRDMATLLLEQGAEINFLNRNGTALDRAKQIPYRKLIKTRLAVDEEEYYNWLISLGAKTKDEILSDLIKEENYDGLDSFVSCTGLKIHSNYRPWDQHIKESLETGNQKMASFLFSRYLLNEKTPSKTTLYRLIFKAAEFGNKELLEFCLDNGCNINSTTNNRKHTILDVIKNMADRDTTSEARKAELNNLIDWMISKGAISHQE